MLCFASCNRNINSLSILSDSHSNVESSGIGKEASIEGANDLAYKYGSMITKPFFGLEDQAKLTRMGVMTQMKAASLEKRVIQPINPLLTEQREVQQTKVKILLVAKM